MSCFRNFNFDFQCTIFKERKEKRTNQLIFKFVQVFVCEFLGTAMLVFWGCACLGEINEADQTVRALMFGIIFGLCIQIFGFDGACHINPAITFSYFVFGYISLVFFFYYVFSQVLGGIAGYMLLELVAHKQLHGPTKKPNFCCTTLRKDLGEIRGLFWEAATTGTLCFMVCSIIDPRNKDKLESIPIKFTLCVFCMVYIGMPYTGGSTNPVRSFGPAVYHGFWDEHWIYWLAPMYGSAFASVLYHIFFLSKDDFVRERLDPVSHTSPVPQVVRKVVD